MNDALTAILNDWANKPDRARMSAEALVIAEYYNGARYQRSADGERARGLAAEAAEELAAKDAAIEAARYALMVSMWDLELTDDGEDIVARCAGCCVEREDLQNGADRHDDACVVADALDKLAALRKDG